MTALPIHGYISDLARDEAEVQQALEDTLDVIRQSPGGASPTTLTIAGGVVTPTIGIHGIDTEAAAATDDLTNIAQTNLPDGSLLIINGINAAHVVTVKHGAGGVGQILLADSVDLVLSSTIYFLVLRRNGAQWLEITRTSTAMKKGLLGRQVFGSPGTATYTPTPGTKFVIPEVGGAGAGGGGCALTGAGQNAIGRGGGGGGYAKKLITSGFAGVTVTVGAGGTGGTAGANPGNAGGTSSFGAFCSATGGNGGNGGPAVAPPQTNGFSAPGGGSGGDVNAIGGYSIGSPYMQASTVTGSVGGGCVLGGAGGGLAANASTTGSAGSAANFPGCGGGGAANAQNQGAGLAGGNGADGIVIVWEYA